MFVNTFHEHFILSKQRWSLKMTIFYQKEMATITEKPGVSYK